MPRTVKNLHGAPRASPGRPNIPSVASDGRAQVLLAIDRGIGSLHAVTVAELLRSIGETATATQVEHGDASGWKSAVFARLERMPEERLRSLAAMLKAPPAQTPANDRELERVRRDLHGEILEIKRRLDSRPVVVPDREDGVWRERLPRTWDDVAALVPAMSLARDRLRGVADDIRAELVDTSYGLLEVAVAGKLVLQPIAQIIDGITMAERRAGDWAVHRASIAQGMMTLEIGIAVLQQGEVEARLTRPALAAQALARGAFAD